MLEKVITPKLFTPFGADALSLDHRIVMAPLTQMRSNPGDRPDALTRDETPTAILQPPRPTFSDPIQSRR